MTLADVTPVGIGSAASALAAVENGKVDAAFLTSFSFETLRARRLDIKALFDLRAAEGNSALFSVPNFPVSATVASSRWLTANPDTARHLTRALAWAARWIHDHPVAEVAAELPPSLRPPSPESPVRTLEISMPMLSRDDRMPPGGPEAVLHYLKLAVEPSLNVDLAKTYTNEFLEPAP